METNEKPIHLYEESLYKWHEDIETGKNLTVVHAELTTDIAVRFGVWLKYGLTNIESAQRTDEEHFDYFINNIYKP